MFRVCELDDTGTYSVEITEFVKNGEKDQTDCWLEVEGKYFCVTNVGGGQMMRKLYFARVSPHLHVPAEGPECGGARPLRV